MIGSVCLGLLLILGGLTVALHLPVPLVVLGIMAFVTGILVLVGK